MKFESTWNHTAVPILKHFAAKAEQKGQRNFDVVVSELAEEIGKTLNQTDSEIYRLKHDGYIDFTHTIDGDTCYKCAIMPKGAKHLEAERNLTI